MRDEIGARNKNESRKGSLFSAEDGQRSEI